MSNQDSWRSALASSSLFSIRICGSETVTTCHCDSCPQVISEVQRCQTVRLFTLASFRMQVLEPPWQILPFQRWTGCAGSMHAGIANPLQSMVNQWVYSVISCEYVQVLHEETRHHLFSGFSVFQAPPANGNISPGENESVTLMQ